MEYMRKKAFLIVLILTLLIFSFSLYADDPTESFIVETIVGARHGLKLAETTVATPTSVSDFTDITAYTSKFSVTDTNYNTQQTVRKITAYWQNPAGLYITLAASAMTSEEKSSFIKYTVTAGRGTVANPSRGVDTLSTIKVTDKNSLNNIDFYGTDIKITVNTDDYLNAITGTYTGTIKVTLVSN